MARDLVTERERDQSPSPPTADHAHSPRGQDRKVGNTLLARSALNDLIGMQRLLFARRGVRCRCYERQEPIAQPGWVRSWSPFRMRSTPSSGRLEAKPYVNIGRLTPGHTGLERAVVSRSSYNKLQLKKLFPLLAIRIIPLRKIESSAWKNPRCYAKCTETITWLGTCYA